METAEEDVRPVELPLFCATVEVLRIRMFEVEADQVDACGAEVIREEHRPISVGEAPEIPKGSEGRGLRCRHGRPGESEIFQDLFVERLPGLEFHPNPRGA